MRSFFSRLGCSSGAALTLFIGAGDPHVVTAAPEGNTWPRVAIGTSRTGRSVQWALQGASDWLADPRCRALFSEFRDERGVPLASQLAPMGVDEPGYLRLVLFRDGADTTQCNRDKTVLFTSRGGRVVFVCRKFHATWQDDPDHAKALLIHEALHTLGLGENPPTSQEITRRVRTACDRRDDQQRR